MRLKTVGLMFSITLLAGLTLSAAGCARKTKSVSPEFAKDGSVTVETTRAVETKPESQGDKDSKLGGRDGSGLREGEMPIRQTQDARNLLFTEAKEELKPIYFDYDSSVLRSSAKAQLENAADWLKQNTQVNCRIEGHCDERGTNEYNLSLGERRALAARRYLISLGINNDRIFTISYGEERPAKSGHDESAWKFNRRDEFKISF